MISLSGGVNVLWNALEQHRPYVFMVSVSTHPLYRSVARLILKEIVLKSSVDKPNFEMHLFNMLVN